MMRYSFSGFPPGGTARLRSAVVLGASLLLILATQSLPAIITAIVLAVVGTYFLLKPPNPDFYVELSEDELTIKLFGATRIKYDIIESADYHRPMYHPLVRVLLNFFISLIRLAGSRLPTIPPPGEISPSEVVLRLRQPISVFRPFPPFVIRKKKWLVFLDDNESFLKELSSKLAKKKWT